MRSTASHQRAKATASERPTKRDVVIEEIGDVTESRRLPSSEPRDMDESPCASEPREVLCAREARDAVGASELIDEAETLGVIPS